MRAIGLSYLSLSFARPVLSVCPRLQESLVTALGSYAGLSTFREMLNSHPGFLNLVVPNDTGRVTALIPDDEALHAFSAQNGELRSIPEDGLVTIFKYHFMVSEVKGSSFIAPVGIKVPTWLENEEFNNRSASAALAQRFVKVRDGGVSGDVELRGGMGLGGDLNTLDGQWDAPNSQAFAAAGNPDQNLDRDQLKNALLFHTLPFPAYSNFLEDGQEIVSLANMTVRVSMRNGETYFNDARLVSPNVLTNNRLIHVLDRVMSPLNDPAAAAPTGSETGTATAPGTQTETETAQPSTNTGRLMVRNEVLAGLIVFSFVGRGM
ncbi:uncharacterized protein BCR38DRAFT_523901 [Pseudomassariella vexata]|uniref:FAS1 domain-containing protein n=1 Tax=Pseudomassariella vexata TaxID=1141098 RepID=A0A1Y2E1M5_9PEZI|nr:uncharacterized protein BCR38DRAFT_523901 [Pseudomassariella vexata]ORY65451.1 hypothetical protein BCR38DRAFT_523901 [Pseudomassariella vexata]